MQDLGIASLFNSFDTNLKFVVKGPFEPAAEDCGSDVPNVGYQPYRNYERWNPMRDFVFLLFIIHFYFHFMS